MSTENKGATASTVAPNSVQLVGTNYPNRSALAGSMFSEEVRK
jgi:hypothetical protein